METRNTFVRLAVLLALTFLLGCVQPGYDAWFSDSLVKVFPDDAAPAETGASPEVLIPRNGHASLQLAVRPVKPLSGFSISSSVTGPDGTQLETKVERVGTVHVNANTPDSEESELIRKAPGEFPDPLFPSIPAELEAGKTEVFWLSFHAPAATPPGDYQGQATISIDGTTASTMPFTVTVTKAKVPETQTLKVTNWFNTSFDHFSSFYPLEGDREKYWTVFENIGRVMAEHRQNVILTPVPDLVIVTWEKGKYAFDFSEFDRWVETFTRVGLIGTIEGGHLLSRPTGYFSPVVVPAWVQEGGELVHKMVEPDDNRAERYLRSYLTALYSHLEEKGWTGKYVQHLHDEPHGDEIPIYEKYAQIVKETLPGVKMVDAVDLEQDTGFLGKYLDVWVPVLSSFDDQFEKLAEHRQNGGETWYYTCIVPQGGYLNRFIDYSLVKMRLLHWFNYRHDLPGYLHWGGNYWSEKPFENVEPVINDGKTLLPPGDNALVYPDPERLSVLSSIRLAVMREGIEDYELLVEMAKRDPEQAGALAKELIPNVLDYKRDVADFRRIHAQLLQSSAWD